MKQEITKEQWNELSDITGVELSMFLTKDLKDDGTPTLPNIGQLIEFLGDDFVEISRVMETDYLNKKQTIKFMVKIDGTTIIMKELIDTIWEATKYKLKEEH